MRVLVTHCSTADKPAAVYFEKLEAGLLNR